jgi:hypothetical protein
LIPASTSTSGRQRLQRRDRLALAVAERDQRLQDVALRARRHARRLHDGVAELAFQLEEQSLGGLLADPGNLDQAAALLQPTARASSSTDIPERIESAVRGPTPEILIRRRNVARSSWVRKPNRIWASSRTTKCVSSVTRSPARAGCRSSTSDVDLVADAADVDEDLRRRLGGERSGEAADHGAIIDAASRDNPSPAATSDP